MSARNELVPSSTTAPEEEPAAVPHRWRTLFTMTGVMVVDSTEGSTVTSLFPTIARSLGLDNGHLGILAAAGKIVAVPFGPAWVWLAGKTSRRTVLALSTSAGGIFGVLAGFSGGFPMLLICTTLMAAALIGGQPIANAVVSDTFADRDRGRAVGAFYGVIAVATAVVSPILAQLSRFSDGWRWGMWILGAICILGAGAVFGLFKDPGVGAAERQLADLSAAQRDRARPTPRSVLGLFRVPTYSLMMLSRLLSGHLLITVFGIQFLVSVRGFDNAAAAIVALPFGIGYFAGTLGGGFAVSALDRVLPHRGRIVFLQAAQVFFALAAFFGTQFGYGSIGIYAIFWALMGFGQGLNPGANRPIVMAVTLPEVRGQAFAIMISVFESIGWGLFSIGAGLLADSLGLQQVFLWILVVLMLVNATVLTALYRTYPRDVRHVAAVLERRRAEALAH